MSTGPARPSASEPPVLPSEPTSVLEVPAPAEEPSAEQFELAAEELAGAAAQAEAAAAPAAPTSKLVPRIVMAVAALVIVGIVGAGFLSQIRKSEVAVEADREPSAQQASDSADEPYDPLAGAMSVDALTGDTKARSELELFGSAPADGSTEFADVVFSSGGQKMGYIYLEFALVSRDPGEWYVATFDEGAGFYEFGIQKGGELVEVSQAQYGNPVAALRDGLSSWLGDR